LPGFSTVKREGIALTTGFTANVNADLKVGSLEETVTVTGESPIVDTQNVEQQQTLSREILDAIPTSRRPAQFITLIVGADGGAMRQPSTMSAASAATAHSSACTVSAPTT
jgi:hypothetical protein